MGLCTPQKLSPLLLGAGVGALFSLNACTHEFYKLCLFIVQVFHTSLSLLDVEVLASFIGAALRFLNVFDRE